jgi:hypothetical protein
MFENRLPRGIRRGQVVSQWGAHGFEPSMPRVIIREAERVPMVAGLRVGTAARRGAVTFV